MSSSPSEVSPLPVISTIDHSTDSDNRPAAAKELMVYTRRKKNVEPSLH